MQVFQLLAERFLLLLVDVIALAISLYLFLDIQDLARLAGTPAVLSFWMQQDTASHFIAYLTSAVLVVYWLWSRRHYSARIPFWDELGQLLGVLGTGFFTEIGLTVLLSHEAIDWGQVLGTWLTALVLIPVLRALVKHLLLYAGLWRREAIIIGDGDNGRAAYSALRAEPLMGYHIRWFAKGLEADNLARDDHVLIGDERIPLIDLSEDPLGTIHRLGKPQIIIALDGVTGNEEFVSRFGTLSTNVLVFPILRGLPFQGVEISHFFGQELLMLQVKNNLLRRGPRAAKRLFDIFCAAVLLLLLSPIFLLLSLIIRRDGAPAMYGHTRIGSGGREFRCLKFRSMVANAEEALNNLLMTDAAAKAEWELDFKLKNDPRVTSLGKFLRRSSLDELPQLINVLRGEMSLVGPRPIVREELERYSDKAAYYLQVRPGITGLWQVSGRNDVDYPTRVGFDVWYVKNWSLWTDIVILIKTVKVVAFRVGAY